MKDSEFIELLNLYLDHEITASDAARLEAEVQSNPSRRRLYQDYCRMQKACKLLTHDFATTTAVEPERKVVAFDSTARKPAGRRRVAYAAGALVAAAAAVALILVERSPSGPSSGVPSNAVVQSVPVKAVAPLQQPDLVAASTAPIQSRRMEGLSLRRNPQDELAVTPAALNDPHFTWIQDVRLTPLQVPVPTDQLRFELNPAVRTENRTYTSGNKTLSPDVPSIAIRFQR